MAAKHLHKVLDEAFDHNYLWKSRELILRTLPLASVRNATIAQVIEGSFTRRFSEARDEGQFPSLYLSGLAAVPVFTPAVGFSNFNLINSLELTWLLDLL